MLTKPADVVAGSFKLTSRYKFFYHVYSEFCLNYGNKFPFYFSSENFDAFLQKLGVSYLTRTVANKSTPTIDVTVKGDGNISMKQVSQAALLQVEILHHFSIFSPP